MKCNAFNTWFEQGEYDVKVKAIDIHNAESEWSDPLIIILLKNKYFVNRLLQDFLEKHPIQSQLIQRMFRFKKMI